MTNTTIGADAMTAATAAIERCAAVEAAYLLGSAATGRLRGDSDVDVAILLRRGTSLSVRQRLALTGELAALLGRPVDLGLLSTANVVYAKEAVATGKMLFQRDALAVGRFAMLALSMYAALQEARREVLRAYAA